MIGEAVDADPSEERLVLRAGKRTFRDVRLEGNRLWGSRYEVEHFPDGYRGKTPNGLFFLSENDAGRLTGVIGSRIPPTTVTYEEDPESHRIESSGRVTARGFGITLDHDTLIVRRRFCTDVFHRTPGTEIFHGKPECWQAGLFGADLHIPEAFFQRPAGEQVVFLSIFLS